MRCHPDFLHQDLQIHRHISASLFRDVRVEANLPHVERWTGKECAQLILSADSMRLWKSGAQPSLGTSCWP